MLLDIPAVAAQDVKVSVEDNLLTISGEIPSEEASEQVTQHRRERRVGRFSRSFRLPPPGILMLTRLQFGFYSVLARLDAEVDYAAVEEAFL